MISYSPFSLLEQSVGERVEEEGGLFDDGLAVQSLLDDESQQGHHGEPSVLDLLRLEVERPLGIGRHEFPTIRSRQGRSPSPSP